MQVNLFSGFLLCSHCLLSDNLIKVLAQVHWQRRLLYFKVLEEQWHTIMKRSTQLFFILTQGSQKAVKAESTATQVDGARWWRDRGTGVTGVHRRSSRQSRGRAAPLTAADGDTMTRRLCTYLKSMPYSAGGQYGSAPFWQLGVFHAVTSSKRPVYLVTTLYFNFSIIHEVFMLICSMW